MDLIGGMQKFSVRENNRAKQARIRNIPKINSYYIVPLW